MSSRRRRRKRKEKNVRKKSRGITKKTKRKNGEWKDRLSVETIQDIISRINNNQISKRKAQRLYGISRTALTRLVENGGRILNAGPKTALSEELELRLVKFIKQKSRKSETLSIFRIIVLANCLMRIYMNSKRTLGTNWYNSFMRRYSGAPHFLKQRKRRRVEKNRLAALVPENAEAFFDNLEKLLKKEKIKPRNIFNLDEKGINNKNTAGGDKGVGDGKLKGFYTKEGQKDKVENVTLEQIIGVYDVLPLLFCFKGEPGEMTSKMANVLKVMKIDGQSPQFAVTKRGYANGDYMVAVARFLIDWLDKNRTDDVLNGEKFLLILDSVPCHKNKKFQKLCVENNILLAYLPTNSTNASQPLDVLFFGNLEKQWENVLGERGYKWQTHLHKLWWPIYQRCCLKYEMRDGRKVYTLAESSFRTTGIYPLNKEKFVSRFRGTVTSNTTSKSQSHKIVPEPEDDYLMMFGRLSYSMDRIEDEEEDGENGDEEDDDKNKKKKKKKDFVIFDSKVDPKHIIPPPTMKTVWTQVMDPLQAMELESAMRNEEKALEELRNRTTTKKHAKKVKYEKGRMVTPEKFNKDLEEQEKKKKEKKKKKKKKKKPKKKEKKKKKHKKKKKKKKKMKKDFDDDFINDDDFFIDDGEEMPDISELSDLGVDSEEEDEDEEDDESEAEEEEEEPKQKQRSGSKRKRKEEFLEDEDEDNRVCKVLKFTKEHSLKSMSTSDMFKTMMKVELFSKKKEVKKNKVEDLEGDFFSFLDDGSMMDTHGALDIVEILRQSFPNSRILFTMTPFTQTYTKFMRKVKKNKERGVIVFFDAKNSRSVGHFFTLVMEPKFNRRTFNKWTVTLFNSLKGWNDKKEDDICTLGLTIFEQRVRKAYEPGQMDGVNCGFFAFFCLFFVLMGFSGNQVKDRDLKNVLENLPKRRCVNFVCNEFKVSIQRFIVAYNEGRQGDAEVELVEISRLMTGFVGA